MSVLPIFIPTAGVAPTVGAAFNLYAWRNARLPHVRTGGGRRGLASGIRGFLEFPQRCLYNMTANELGLPSNGIVTVYWNIGDINFTQYTLPNRVCKLEF